MQGWLIFSNQLSIVMSDFSDVLDGVALKKRKFVKYRASEFDGGILAVSLCMC